MRKVLFMFVVIVLTTLFNQEVEASSDYKNLINTNLIQYDEKNDKFYCDQEIELLKNTNYTFVARYNFFGEVTQNKKNALDNGVLDVKYILGDEFDSGVSFVLNYAPSGLYYSTITPKINCIIKFQDLLTKGYNDETLPKEEVIFFEGTTEEFQGFRCNDILEGYSKIENYIEFYTTPENLLTVEKITGSIKCYDNECGFDYVNIVTDNYQNNCNIGEYKILYEASDEQGNVKNLTVQVKVVDNQPPVITGPDIIEWDCYTTDATIEKALLNYEAYDNVDGDITSSLKSRTPINFIFERGVKKDYEFIIVARDSSGNETTKTIIIRSKDLFPPELTVKNLDINLSSIGTLSFVTSFDFLVESVSDYSNYYKLSYDFKEVVGKIGFSGKFHVYITASDEEGNETTRVAVINVIDDIDPEFYIQTDLLNTTIAEVYSLDEIKSIINEKLHKNGILYDSVDLISCNYLSNENTPGQYKVKYAYGYKGHINYAEGIINVKEKEDVASEFWIFVIAGVPILIGIIYIVKRKKELY